MPSLNFGHIAVGVSLLLACTPASAVICLVDPIVPPCCPTPCPVFDPIRVPKLLADVTSLKLAIDADTQLVKSASQLSQTIGDTRAAVTSVARQLSAFPSTISGELTAMEADLPTNPVAALGALKQTIFETGGASQSSTTQSAARRNNRAAMAQQEQVAALAVGLTQSKSLPSSTSLGSQLAQTTTGSDQLHADLSANSMARLALYQDVGNLHQLSAAWLAHRASRSALTHPNTGGGTIPQPAAPSAVATPQEVSPTQDLQSTVDQLISLHDSRVSAQTLLNLYPALQQTIASSNLADQFTASAESMLQKSLASLGAGAGANLSDVQRALQNADGSGWLDGDRDAQEQRAVAQVLGALASSGMVPPALAADDSSASLQLKQAMSSWLDANKQSRYWAQLAQNAQNSMATLDRRLGALSDRAGVDLTSASAGTVETALLNKLKQDPAADRWQSLIAAASQDSGAHVVLQRGGAQ